MKKPNHLEGQTSPYLRQHLYNPVDWYPWGEAALEKAKREQKPLLVSVGYSACHWCHVMERESFEDEEVARIMNAHFVCVKVDREERPDIDHLYMNAVQALTGHGGWPLNCFALPDGRPFWGGTYFPKEQWKGILTRIAELFRDQQPDLEEQAQKIIHGISTTGFIEVANQRPAFSQGDVQRMFANLMEYADKQEGGSRGAPKFPLPNNIEFLLHYYHQSGDASALQQAELGLRKMALGGIYDQLGGGFSRYTVDDKWKIPHFEKMLYDNGQLLSAYANAYKVSKDPLFKDVVYETVAFVARELTAPEGVFYSALDADSEGEEGKFYVWKEKEIDNLLGEDGLLFKKFYQVGDKGFWERGNNILLRDLHESDLAESLGMSSSEMYERINRARGTMLAAREKRVRPGLDDKVLTGWNALMIKGLADAYAAFAEKDFLQHATAAADFILEHAVQKDGRLFRSLNGKKADISGFLEDYALFAQALIRLFEVSHSEKYLVSAKKLADYVLANFSMPDTHLFAFSPATGEKLAAPHYEFHDNVMPASNSVMARVLFYLANLYESPELGRRSSLMLNDMRNFLHKYSSSFTNWGILLMHHVKPFHIVAMAGPEAVQKANTIMRHYYPDSLIAATTDKAVSNQIDVLHQRFKDDKTMIHVCSMGACKMPVEDVKEALKQME